MKIKTIIKVLFAVPLFFALAENIFAQRKAVSAKEVTGTFRYEFTGIYKGNYNEIKIQSLGKNKLKVEFILIYPYTFGGTEKKEDITINMGEATGEARIKGDTAVYSDNTDGKCEITIKFIKPGQIKVMQEQEGAGCGFGLNVSAEGTYRKFSNAKPKFESIE